MPLAAALHSYYVSVYIGRSSEISSDEWHRTGWTN